jgi:flagellar FliL protein
MPDVSETEKEASKRRGRLPLVLGLVLACAGGAGGFLAARTGLVQLQGTAIAPAAPQEPTSGSTENVAFVPIDPVVVSLAPSAGGRHLRFSAELEVAPSRRDEVEALRPRIIDVLNGYLRALDETDLEAPGALVRLRAQMLRRVQMVTGDGRVRDLLVMEFVMT